jgi:hypothetical protein
MCHRPLLQEPGERLRTWVRRGRLVRGGPRRYSLAALPCLQGQPGLRRRHHHHQRSWRPEHARHLPHSAGRRRSLRARVERESGGFPLGMPPWPRLRPADEQMRCRARRGHSLQSRGCLRARRVLLGRDLYGAPARRGCLFLQQRVPAALLQWIVTVPHLWRGACLPRVLSRSALRSSPGPEVWRER